ncbi:MAG: methionyl-tRNA formyltransferase [Candidatus Marinimicrobia bacterium]|nr:methionyl-tRNA formyltransferase [Candidatus Neomarinimicrobiota bacterium]
MKIIFMGTPEFAVPALDALVASHHDVLAVVTTPDKPKGRGQSMAMSEVKIRALELDLPVIQPINLKDPVFLKTLHAFDPDILVVVAFRILPPEIYQLPKYGAVNAHASLLPKYRGAAPIHWAIYHGEKETGVTVFQIDKKIDTGRMILQERIPILEEDTTGNLYNVMQQLSADALIKALDMLENDRVDYIKQDDSIATPAPKVHSDTGKLDFSRTGEELCRAVRAFTPWPGAFFYLNGQRVKISKAKWEAVEDTTPGTITLISKKQFAVHCKDGYFLPQELQSPGRRKMDIVDWMNGINLAVMLKVENS